MRSDLHPRSRRWRRVCTLSMMANNRKGRLEAKRSLDEIDGLPRQHFMHHGIDSGSRMEALPNNDERGVFEGFTP